MLERIIKRKFYLQKHLDAPLLKEREDYLKQIEAEGRSRTYLLSIADYLLRMVELLHLSDDKLDRISLAEVSNAADEWARTIKNHPMKRKSTPSSKAKFMRLALDWLEKIRRLDTRYTDNGILLNQLFSRRYFKFQYLEYPMLSERLAYLESWKQKGASLYTLRKIAQYQLHLIDYLHLPITQSVSVESLLAATKTWNEADIPAVHKKSKSLNSGKSFLHIGKDWLTFMNLLKPEEEHVFLRDKLDCYLDWLQKDKGYSKRTVETRFSMLKLFLNHMESTISTLEELTPSAIDGYISKRHDQDGCNRRTIAALVSVMRDFLKYAENKGWCRKGLSLSFKAPRVYHLEDIPSYAPWENVQNIMQKQRELEGSSAIRDYAILSLLSVYGLRCSEVTGLKTKDIDWRKEEIHLHRAKGCRPQVLPLLPEVGDTIIRYIREARQNISGHENLFLCMRAPYRGMSTTSVYKLVSTRLKEEGLEMRHYGPHSLRHSCATHLVNSGHSMKEVGDLLGHQQIETTSIYAKVDLANLRQVAEMSWEGLL